MTIQIKMPAFISAKYDEYDQAWEFFVNTFDMSDMGGYIPVTEIEVEFDLPEVAELTKETVARYRQRQQQLRAEAEMKCNAIEDVLQNLLCIEDKSNG